MTTDDERRQFLRYTRTESWPMLARHPVTATVHRDLTAGMLAVGPDEVTAGVEALRTATARAAAELVADPTVRSALDHLPFSAGDRIVAVGDSVTADRAGWCELLAAALTAARPGGCTVHNLGLSGNTTADVLERFDLLEAARPTHVLMMLGTNDARQHGRRNGHRMVTGGESERNLRALTGLVTGDLGAGLTLITPPPVHGPTARAHFADLPLTWDAAAVADIAARVRTIDPDCIDVHAAMLAHGARELLERDGVHPTPAGQRLIFTTIVRHLAGTDRPAVPAGSSGPA